jgi:hypothetical protein
VLAVAVGALPKFTKTSLSVHPSRVLLGSGSPPASTRRPACRCSGPLQIRGESLREWVLLTEQPPGVSQGLLVQREGLLQPPRRLIGEGEGGRRDQGVGVLRPEQPPGVGQGLLE